MHVLSILAVVCGFLGLVGILASFASDPGLGRRIVMTSAASLIMLSTVTIGALAFAQQPVCEALGGGWHGPEASCLNEWGGNGNNDPAP
jgi:hypothetical protein